MISPTSLTEIPMRSSTSSSVKMIVLWITLLFLHQGYSDSLVPVKPVQLGEPATLTCELHNKDLSGSKVLWYKQSLGNTLKLIVTLYGKAEYAQEAFRSRFNAYYTKNLSCLTILKTVQEDEGIYHCGITSWLHLEWNATYLLVKGNTQRTSNYTVVQWPAELDPLHRGEAATLQCSVLSDTENRTCPRDLSVFWFRARSHKSHPNIIYSGGNKHHECEKRSETQQSCVYRFTKNVSFSDAGTYYCAVATCGEILFGNGTELKFVEAAQSRFILVAILIVCLAISVIGNVFLICKQRGCKSFKGTQSAISDAQTDTSHQPTDADDGLNYAALNFSERKTRGRRKKEFTEDSVYSQVKH